MRKMIARFIHEDAGQDLIEYALLAGIITAVGALLIAALATKVGTLFTDLKNAIGA